MKMPVLTAAFAALAIASSAFAHDYKLGSLVIDHPWSRATPKGASVAGGYMKITNTGTTPDRLVGGSTDVAKRFEIHEMSMDGGVMKMRELSNGLEIPPGASVELKPGSYHVMLQNLARQLHQGRTRQGVADVRKSRQGRDRVHRRGGRRRPEGAQALNACCRIPRRRAAFEGRARRA